MIDVDKALAFPSAVFEQPEDVVATQELNTEQKCQALRQWDNDLRELMVATDENMEPEADSGRTADLVTRIDALLRELDPD
ncbi:MAG: hypothetical protein EA417_20395 [Gammaproteobacteria bacterium]|nr:MAG: hypothetical protein EA417_20395 [Gammaproteobacteria bacterium]